MTITTLRPNAFTSTIIGAATGAPAPDDTWKSWVVDTSGTLTANVSDNSNSTRIKQPVNTNSVGTFTVGGWRLPNTLSLSAGQYIDKVRYRYSYDIQYISNGMGMNLDSHFTKNGYDGKFNGLNVNNFFCSTANVGTTTSIITFTSAWMPKNPDTGTNWTTSNIANDYSIFLTVGPYGAGDLRARIYEVWLEVSINTLPTITSGPTGTVSTSTTPALTIAYSDVDGDIPDREDIRVFSQAQYSAVGFNPETSANVFQQIGPRNGFGLSTFSYSIQLPISLQNNTTYKVYARLRQQVDAKWSDWGISTFTIALDAPLAPALIGTLLNSQAAVKLSIASKDNLLSAQQSSLELGNTTSWAAGASTTIAFSTSQFLDGLGSLQLTRIGSTGNAAAQIASGSRVAVAPGAQYTALASFRANSTIRSCTVTIGWYDGTGTSISAATSAPTSNTNSGWTQITSTSNAPSNAVSADVTVTIVSAAASEIHYVDRIGIMPGNTNTWGLGGYSDPQYITVEASVDGGVTWNIVRNGALTAWQNLLANTADITWYEAPPGVSVSYRAAIIGLLSGNTVQSPYSTIVNLISVPVGDPFWWIIDPLDSNNNMQVDMSGTDWSFNKDEAQGVFRPLGATNPIVVSDVVQSMSGSLPCYFEDRSLYDAFDAMRNKQHTILIKRVYAAAMDQFYVRFGANLKVTEYNTTPISIQTEISFNEVAAP